jgi:hypothetical protein
MVQLASLPRALGEPLRDAIEERGVPVVMLRGSGLLGPDGVRDVDLFIPRVSAAWVEARFGARRDALHAEAATARAAAAPASPELGAPGPEEA